MELYDASVTFPGFTYPAGLEKIVDLGLTDLDVWFESAIGMLVERSKEEESDEL